MEEGSVPMSAVTKARKRKELLVETKKWEHILSMLKDLHWVPIQSTIMKTLNTLGLRPEGSHYLTWTCTLSVKGLCLTAGNRRFGESCSGPPRRSVAPGLERLPAPLLVPRKCCKEKLFKHSFNSTAAAFMLFWILKCWFLENIYTGFSIFYSVFIKSIVKQLEDYFNRIAQIKIF